MVAVGVAVALMLVLGNTGIPLLDQRILAAQQTPGMGQATLAGFLKVVRFTFPMVPLVGLAAYVLIRNVRDLAGRFGDNWLTPAE